MPAIKTIMAPTDFSPHSEEATRYAADLAQKLNARLILFYVFDRPLLAGTYDEHLHVPGGIRPEDMDKMGDAASHKVDEEVQRFKEEGIDAEARVAEGHPADEIVKGAQALGVDLIVMGTHGRRGVNRLLLGSVTAKVVRAATCPVLSAPPAALGKGS